MNLTDKYMLEQMEEERRNHKHGDYSATVSISLQTIGFILTVLFLIFKVNGLLDISWFWVFFPLWILPAIGLALFAIGVVIFIFCLPKIMDEVE